MELLSRLFFNSESRDEKNEMTYIIKGYPITNFPVVPDILKHQVEMKTLNDKYGSPIVALTLAHEGSDLVEPESLEVIRKYMKNWFNEYPELAKYFEKELPQNLLAISFTHENFQMGKMSCHDFKLANGYKEAENSFYTYRKLSESVQCVYYNENGTEYPAGACFYPTPYGKPKLLESNNALLLFATGCRIAYPLEDRMKSYDFVTFKIYGRYCATSGRNMMVTCDASDGIPRHWDYDHETQKYTTDLCYECCEDYFNYKWEEPKKDTPAIPATVSDPASVTSIQAPAVFNDSEAVPVSQDDSTESFIEEFEKIEMSKENAESDIDAELID